MSTKVTMGKDPVDEKVEEVELPPVDNSHEEDTDVSSESAPTQEDSVDVPEEDSGQDDAGVDLENLDPSLEVWPDGPTVGQTLAWKEEYGEVYTTSLTLDFHVMWRPMNRLEYKRHVKQMEQLSQAGKLSPAEINMIQEEALTELCTLFPKYSNAEMANELAGMPSIIAQQVMEASGFTALEVRQL